MKYAMDFDPRAKRDIARLKQSEPAAYDKLLELLDELKEHPRTGRGKPERLKGNRAGQWSRRITKRHRLIYVISDNKVVVLVLGAYGHYNDR